MSLCWILAVFCLSLQIHFSGHQCKVTAGHARDQHALSRVPLRNFSREMQHTINALTLRITSNIRLLQEESIHSPPKYLRAARLESNIHHMLIGKCSADIAIKHSSTWGLDQENGPQLPKLHAHGLKCCKQQTLTPRLEFKCDRLV